MNAAEWMSLGSVIVAAFSTVLVYVKGRRKTNEETTDIIAKRRLGEIERLYVRVEKLEKIVESLQESDEQKQKTIDAQAEELDHTNRTVGRLRRIIVDFAARVETAWVEGHTMPTLTPDEREILESTIPRAPRGPWRNHE